jgi:hypothetical protein
VFGSGNPWRGLSLPHSWVMCSDGKVITVLPKWLLVAQVPCDRPEMLDEAARGLRRRPPVEVE